MSSTAIQAKPATTAKRSSLSQNGGGWQAAMRAAVTDVDTLFARLALPATHLDAARRASRAFGLRVPESYLARMQPGNIDDPLLRQVLPIGAESRAVAGFSTDAVGDTAAAAGDGLLHKYHGRALLITTGACAVHCRYCFRRHFDYAGQHSGGRHTERALARIAADASISEVILSGGDPLSLTNARLDQLGAGLDAIDHVKRIRMHTRTAVVLPERVDDGLIAWIAARRARCVIVIHANHANELSAQAVDALARLRATGATLLNQSVLLRGVNDDAGALAALSLKLFDCGVIPYYLHLLDRVAGTYHFEVDEPRAAQLMQSLSARLPGYLVPRLARETSGAPAKSVLGHIAADRDNMAQEEDID